jgi:hypothetical protein
MLVNIAGQWLLKIMVINGLNELLEKRQVALPGWDLFPGNINPDKRVLWGLGKRGNPELCSCHFL